MSLITSIISGAIQIAQLFFGKKDDSGGQSVNLSSVLLTIAQNLMTAIPQAIQFGSLDTKEKFDDFLEAFDAFTGMEATAINVIKDMPPEKAEVFFDSIKEAARVYGYHLLKVEGYYL